MRVIFTGNDMGLFDYWTTLGQRTTQRRTQSPTTSGGIPYISSSQPPPQQVRASRPAVGGSTQIAPTPGVTTRQYEVVPDEITAAGNFFQKTPGFSSIYAAGSLFSEKTGVSAKMPTITMKEITRVSNQRVGNEVITTTEVFREPATPRNPTETMIT